MLLYHRVGDAEVDPWAMAVSAAHFSDHLDALRGRTVPLRDMLRSFRAGTLKPDTVALTFDDGYAETVALTQPVLERKQVPATFYVPVGAIDSAREFWWDELEGLILIADVPDRLSIVIGGEQFDWTYPPSERECWTESDRLRARSWRAWEVPAPSPRHALYASLWQRCQQLHSADRERVLAQLRLWAGGPRAPRHTHRTLTAQEARDLSSSSIADFGAHTVTHPALAALSSSEQHLEIEMGRRGLEDVVGRSVCTFAYPFGRRVDYTEETVRLVRTAGFEGACSNFTGAVAKGVDAFQLPRLFVQDWDGDEFNRRLASVAHG